MYIYWRQQWNIVSEQNIDLISCVCVTSIKWTIIFLAPFSLVSCLWVMPFLCSFFIEMLSLRGAWIFLHNIILFWIACSCLLHYLLEKKYFELNSLKQLYLWRFNVKKKFNWCIMMMKLEIIFHQLIKFLVNLIFSQSIKLKIKL